MMLPAMVARTGAASASGTAPICPDVSGRYSVAGDGRPMFDALTAMRAESAGFLHSGVELSGAADGTLTVRTKSGSTGSWSTGSNAVLRAGTDFECSSGRLVFTTPIASAKRKTDEGKWYEGAATISLSRLADGELSIAVRFTGSERIVLFSYESANVSLPKPGTRTTLTDSYRWPTYSDTFALIPTPPVIPEAERLARQRLTPEVLGNVMLGGLKPSGDGALASLTASRSSDVEAFEDRLRAASILYETRVEPVWSNNSYYMELLIRPAGAVADSATRPSAFRIEQELQRTLPALVDVDTVSASENGYVVMLTFSGATPIADVIRLVQLNSPLIGTMELVDESTRAASRIRVVRLKVRDH